MNMYRNWYCRQCGRTYDADYYPSMRLTAIRCDHCNLGAGVISDVDLLNMSYSKQEEIEQLLQRTRERSEQRAARYSPWL